MRSIVLIFVSLLFSVGISYAQTRYKTSEGEIHFNASTPLEDIDGLNKEVNAIIDLESGNFAVVMLIKDFSFPRKLMQEHFNENYLESDIFPKATFSGSIENLEFDKTDEVFAEHTISGKITIHGVTRKLNAKVQIRRKGNSIIMNSGFVIRPEDHGVEVPKIVFKKIAREVQVSVKLDLSKE
ncbi:MAG: YceI family protein [Flavobacteriaceae bacterium]